MKNRVVLIIDDEENVISSLKRLLRKEPYAVVGTTSPKSAFEILEHMKVSLIITDQRMEGFDGDEVIDKVRHEYPDVKCIKLTGYSKTAGTSPDTAWKVVTKPWNDDEIKRTIRQAMDTEDHSGAFHNAINQEEK